MSFFNKYVKVNPKVFYPSSVLIIIFVFFCAIFTKNARHLFSYIQIHLVHDFGWLYVLSVGIFVIFCLILIFSKYGDIKLGADHIEPEFSYIEWFSMLFSAGMGIGIIFYGVAEPLIHYIHPPIEASKSAEAAKDAMRISFFHWGIHAWSIYAVVGLAIAYSAFKNNLPINLRSSLFPIFKEKNKWEYRKFNRHYCYLWNIIWCSNFARFRSFTNWLRIRAYF